MNPCLRALLLGLLWASLGSAASLGAQEFTGPVTEPLPYEELEFPSWAHDVRRFEVVFFGAVPLTYILTSLVYDFSLYASHDFDTEYGMGTQRSQDDLRFMLAVTVSLSAGIALTDWVVGRARKNRRAPQE